MVTVTFKVRFYETDMMGVVHHTNHIRWFEMGRVEYLRQAGVDLNELMAEDILFPIKKVSCEYIESVTFDDELILETTMPSVSRAQMTFNYILRRKRDGALIAKGSTQNVFINMKTGKIIRLKGDKIEKLVAFVEAEKNGI